MALIKELDDMDREDDDGQARLTAERDAALRRAEAAEADLVLAMENSNSFMSCEPCVHRGYDPDDGLCCKLKSCKPKWRGPEPGGVIRPPDNYAGEQPVAYGAPFDEPIVQKEANDEQN